MRIGFYMRCPWVLLDRYPNLLGGFRVVGAVAWPYDVEVRPLVQQIPGSGQSGSENILVGVAKFAGRAVVDEHRI